MLMQDKIFSGALLTSLILHIAIIGYLSAMKIKNMQKPLKQGGAGTTVAALNYQLEVLHAARSGEMRLVWSLQISLVSISHGKQQKTSALHLVLNSAPIHTGPRKPKHESTLILDTGLLRAATITLHKQKVNYLVRVRLNRMDVSSGFGDVRTPEAVDPGLRIADC